jgi:23S rRNA pseudouridine955/2504/2580 synthase
VPKFSLDDLLVYEDEHYLILNKPPGISTLEDRNDPRNLLALIREVEPRAQVGHRLDKDTSGVLVVARHPEAYRHISMQFEHRQVTKVYHAVADGLHRFDQVEVDRSILVQKDGTVRLAVGGKPAQTIFQTLETYRFHTLLECKPVTGRMHQIRIHAAFLQAPLSGDSTYGGKPIFLSQVKASFKLKKEAEEEPLMKRMALHAYSIEFQNLNEQKTEFTAPYPKDFRALITQLQRQKR